MVSLMKFKHSEIGYQNRAFRNIYDPNLVSASEITISKTQQEYFMLDVDVVVPSCDLETDSSYI